VIDHIVEVHTLREAFWPAHEKRNADRFFIEVLRYCSVPFRIEAMLAVHMPMVTNVEDEGTFEDALCFELIK
jgi:hypothetical protein